MHAYIHTCIYAGIDNASIHTRRLHFDNKNMARSNQDLARVIRASPDEVPSITLELKVKKMNKSVNIYIYIYRERERVGETDWGFQIEKKNKNTYTP